MLYQFALALTRDPDAAEDVIQESFLGLIKRGPGLGEVRDIRAYLLRVVRNEVTRRWKRRRYDPVRVELVEASDDGSATETAEINEALSRLPEEQLTVVVLKVWHGMTFAEIAAALDIPANTAASRYRYAMEKLRPWLS
jgi:RNA polymerase sigma-70 factor (ECF subfamily)